MRNAIRNLILAPAVLCATAAFAADTSTLNVPFSFTAHGKSYPAGKYSVSVDANRQVATLSSQNENLNILISSLTPADGNPSDPIKVRLEFSDAGSDHQLRKIKYGVFSTADMAGRPTKSEQYSTEHGAARPTSGQ